MKKILSIIVLIMFSVACSSISSTKQAEGFPKVTVEDVNNSINTMLSLIIDSNSEESYINGHIPTAVSFERVKDNLSFILPADKNTEIICYCGSEKCTAWLKAATKIRELGYKNVKHYTGGITGWKEANQFVVDELPKEENI